MSDTDTDIGKKLDGALQAQRTQDALKGGATVGGATAQYGVEQTVKKDTAAAAVALGRTSEEQRIQAQTTVRQDAVQTSNKAQAANLDVQRSLEAGVLQSATLSERLQAKFFGFLDFIGQAIAVLSKPGDFFGNIREALNGLRNFSAPSLNTPTQITAGTVSAAGSNYDARTEERRAVGHVPSPSAAAPAFVAKDPAGVSFLDATTGAVRPAAPDVTSTPARPLVLPAAPALVPGGSGN